MIVIVLALLLVVGYFSLVMQVVNADQTSQNRYNMGYNDGFRNAECHFKHCHGHGNERTAPSGHTNAYDNGYSKGYHDGWNAAGGSGYRSDQQPTQNGTSSISDVAGSE